MNDTAHILSNERELFLQVAAGNETAFTVIFHHYTARLYPFILKRTKSEAITEELLQEIFIKIWNNRAQFAAIDNFSSYIFTTAVHKIYAWFRKTATNERLLKELWQRVNEVRSTTEDIIDMKESQQLINQAIEQLPPQRKKIYQLSREQGMSHGEIAKYLNISSSTVNNQLMEALRYIRRYLSERPDISVLVMVYLLGKGG